MTNETNEESPSARRRGPKPRGRTVTPLTITVTLAQRTALEALADMRQVSISTVIRQFIAVGLSADETRGDDRLHDDAERYHPSLVGAASPSPGGSGSQPVTIAIIDDDPRIVAFVKLALGEVGYRAVEWHTAAGAHDFIAREMPALVLLDVEMETRTAGLKVLEEIADDTSLRAIPIILTSSQKRSFEEETEQRGALHDRILAKPYTVEALLAAVQRALAVGSQRGVSGS